MKVRFLALAAAMVCWWSVTVPAMAQDMLMIRSPQPFPEAMLALQTSITEHGYTVSRVQRVDIGLKTFGFETDKYRVVFFGKADEIKGITDRHPELIAYLPLKIAIFAEEKETLLVAANPVSYQRLFAYQEVADTFARWESDVLSIFEDVSQP